MRSFNSNQEMEEAFRLYLLREEKSSSTIQQYSRDIHSFLQWKKDRPLEKDLLVQYKQELMTRMKPGSVNTKICAINAWVTFLEEPKLKIKAVRIQHQMFLDQEKELSQEEYLQMVHEAYASHKDKIGLILETLCACGIRVSELPFITVKTVQKGRGEIRLKGKVRLILLPARLQEKLLKYINDHQIPNGPVFLNRQGQPLSRSYIWRELKKLALKTGIPEQKVFPHNLRHLFARCYYELDNDLAGLADVLGHSSVSTTKIYLSTSAKTHQACINKMNLLT